MNDDLKINLKMHLHQIGSISYAARELALALERKGCDVKITDVPADFNLSAAQELFRPGQQPNLERLAQKQIKESEYCHLRFTGETDFDDLSPGSNIFMYPWDFDPNHGYFGAVPRINDSYDAAWFMSNHTLAAYVNIGVHRDQTYLVPHGVDTDLFNLTAAPKQFDSVKRFKFLFVGLPIKRKGIDVLLPAYAEEFHAHEDVCLVIKTKGFNWPFLLACQETVRQIKPAGDLPEILYLVDEEPLSAMPSYFSGCDCFVFPTRGESFGLAVAEAMACGKPVITTRWGGATDYCNRRNSLLLDYTFTEAFAGDLPGLEFCPGSLWAEPDKAQLKRYMRQVYDHQGEAKELGRQAHREIASHWTWDHAADKAVEALRDMSARVRSAV